MGVFEEIEENYKNLKRSDKGLLYDLLGIDDKSEEDVLDELEGLQEDANDVDLCYKLIGGVCMAAGSEYCSFECPFNH